MREQRHAPTLALTGIALALAAVMPTAMAEVGPNGLPSVEHVNRGAQPEKARMSSRFAQSSKSISAMPRGVAADMARAQGGGAGADTGAGKTQERFGRPLQTGSTRELREQDRQVGGGELQWHATAGGHAATLTFHADGASGMRLRVRLEGPAHGVKLRFVGSGAPDEVTEVAGEDVVKRSTGSPDLAKRNAMVSAMNAAATFWSPPVHGDTLTVEIFAESGIDYRSIKLSGMAVMHIDRMVVHEADGGLGTATLTCHRDVACRPDQSESFKAATRSTIGLSFVSNGNNYWCSGTLVNSNTSPRQAYAITANHCISTQEAANTAWAVFFMDATACGSGQRVPQAATVQEGATLLYTNQANDHTLLRINGRMPDGAFYAGWTPSAIATGTGVLGIHHPAGDLKKYSEGAKEADNGRLTGYAGTFHQVRWNTGAVEGGSSGSGLFRFNTNNNSWQLVGQLLGTLGTAAASCTSSALYGRFQDVYAAGKPWLDPTNPLAIVNSASYQGLDLAPSALVAAFGPGVPQTPVSRIASDRVSAADSRCALTLGGRYSATVRSLASGATSEACLLYMGGGQVNMMLPAQMQAGERVDVEVTDALTGQVIARAPNAPVSSFAPGIFTANARGSGVPAGNILRIRNGVQKYEAIPTDPSTPIDLGPADEEVYLILYGTGLRGKAGSTTATSTVGGFGATIDFIGAQGNFLGLDQVNLRIPKGTMRTAGFAGKAIVELRFTEASGKQFVPNQVEIYVR